MTHAPGSLVPCNFGIKFLQDKKHGNVTLILRNEEHLLANSVILSLNSPEFDRLTSELGLQFIEMTDFSEKVVQRFIESFYTGKMDEIEDKHFRDLNKMSHVFQVDWLSAICKDYFTDRLNSLSDNDFDGMLFLFGEMCFMHGTLNDNSLSHIVIRHIQYLDAGEDVVLKSYVGKLVDLSIKDLDLVILLAGNNISLLQKCMLLEIKKNMVLHDNVNYLLNNIKLSIGKEQESITFDELFETLRNLENLTSKDLRMVMTLYSKAMDDFCGRKEIMATSSSKAMPNLFRRSFEDIREVINPVSLAVQDFIGIPELLRKAQQYADDMYMLVSVSCFIFSSFFQLYKVSSQDLSKKHINDLVEKVIDQAVRELTRTRVSRGWSRINPDYLLKKSERVDHCLGDKSYETSVGNILNKFINKLQESDVTSGSDRVELGAPRTKSLTFEKFLTEERKYKSYFKHPGVGACNEPGNCGFLLKVTPALSDNPNNFNIQLCTEPRQYATDIHFHDDVSADKMHFAIKYYSEDGQSQLLCPSYLGKPACQDDLIFWDCAKSEFKVRKGEWMRPIVYYDLTCAQSGI